MAHLKGCFGPTSAGASSIEVHWREQNPAERLFTFGMSDIPLPPFPVEAAQ